jgi:hypothetical protein
MKIIFTLFLFIFLLVNVCFGQKSLPKNFVGTYQICFSRCETIKINTDFTFEFLFEQKPLYKGFLKGEWKIVEQN